MFALATVSLTTTAASIEFTGIPNTYTHLELRMITRSSESAGLGGVYMQFNADTGSNYSWHRVYGDGSSATSGASSSTTSILPGISATTSHSANVFSSTIISVLDYASTSKVKTVRAITGVDANGSGTVALHSGGWYKNTSSVYETVNSIKLIPFNGLWQQYTHVALYGIKAA